MSLNLIQMIFFSCLVYWLPCFQTFAWGFVYWYSFSMRSKYNLKFNFLWHFMDIFIYFSLTLRFFQFYYWPALLSKCYKLIMSSLISQLNNIFFVIHTYTNKYLILLFVWFIFFTMLYLWKLLRVILFSYANASTYFAHNL